MTQSTNLYINSLTAWYKLVWETNRIIIASYSRVLQQTGPADKDYPGNADQELAVQAGQDSFRVAKVAPTALKSEKSVRKISRLSRHK